MALLVLTSIALLICNLGGIDKISKGGLNPYLLFDHQTLQQDDWDNSTQSTVDFRRGYLLASQDSQINMGIDEIVPVAYRGFEEHRFDTEKGAIEVDQYHFDEYLPLKVTDEAVEDWWVTVKVKGGYEPEHGWVILDQVKTDKSGKLKVTWTFVESLDCCTDVWNATFTVKDEFCIDSNQYPDGADWRKYNPDGDTIPGKDLFTLNWETIWKGCPLPNQFFKLILV